MKLISAVRIFFLYFHSLSFSFHFRSLFDGNKVEQFKKKRLTYGGATACIVPATPPQVTYSTPKPPSPNPNHIIGDDGSLDKVFDYELSLDNIGDTTTPEDRELIETITAKLEIARYFGQNGQRSEAECRYLEAIESMQPLSNLPDALQNLEEFRSYLSLSTGIYARKSAVKCLELYELSSSFPVLSNTKIITSMLSTLCRLLQRLRALPFHELICTAAKDMLLNNQDPGATDSVRIAFQAHLRSMLDSGSYEHPNKPTMSTASFFLVMFVWKLRSMVEGGPGNGGHLNRLISLRDIIFELVCMAAQPTSQHSLSELVAEPLLKLSRLLLDQVIQSFWNSGPLTSLVAATTSLATGCSRAGEQLVAEALFKTTISTCERFAALQPSKLRLQIEYCQHLSRQKTWKKFLAAVAELVNIIDCTIQVDPDFSINAELLETISLLKCIPPSPERYLSLNEIQQC